MLNTVRLLAVPGDSNAPNTVVRFQIQRGTNALGVMDVELFDHDKPETVRNFLLYVRSGAYSNSFLHRCVPGFVVQGGGFSVTNAMGASRFSDALAVTNLGRLTNEFLVGPPLSNTFGTIAMAKVGGDPDSATSQWFFNLANNTNLDAQNGGFTVFGRVRGNTNPGEGTNVLRHFNTLSTNAGIVNLSTLLGSAYSVFSELPVAYTNTTSRVPTNNELYSVRISLPNPTNPPGQSPPTLRILSPATNARITNGVVTISGTADDDTGVARVVYRVQDGPLEIAGGTTNWVASITPQPGVNTVTFQSIDCDGQWSTNAPSSTFLYFGNAQLNLQIVGKGRVAGAVNGQILQAGRFYTLTAKPASGKDFDRWTGSVASSNATLTFQVPVGVTNFSLTARFVGDPFPELAGTYHGLFRSTNAPDLTGAGFMTLTLGKSGLFSGKIAHRGGSYRYTGRFDRAGGTFLQGTVGGVSRTVTLRLDPTNIAGVIAGSFLGGTSTSEVQLERLASVLPTTNAPTVGRYTFVLPGDSTSPPNQLSPGGHGFGTATLDRKGLLVLSGTLGDGKAFKTSAMLTRSNRWPVHLAFLGSRGVLAGWLSFGSNQPAHLDGSLHWMKSFSAKDVTYPAGFSNQVAFLASRYAPPTKGNRLLNWVNGLAQIAGAGLLPGFTNHVSLATNNTLTVTDSNTAALSLILDLKTGLVRGNFVHPWAGTVNKLRGVILARTDHLQGQFVDGNQTGSLDVHKSPFLLTHSVTNLTLAGLSAALREGGHLRFEGDGVITLTNPLSFRYDTTLDANGHQVVISGGDTTRLFEVPTNLNFTAVGLTLANGRHLGPDGANGFTLVAPQPGGDGCGAGILNLGGVVALTNCVLTNFFVQGGSGGTESDFGFDRITVPGGRGLGAVICNRGGRVLIHGCTFADNLALGGTGLADSSTNVPISAIRGSALGGAVFSDGGECEVSDTLFLRNQARGADFGGNNGPDSYTEAGGAAGGALAIVGGRLLLAASDCRSNMAVAGSSPPAHVPNLSTQGGALFVETNAEAVIERTTFGGNSAQGGSSFLGATTPRPGQGRGGAVFSAGLLRLRECTLENNRALGGRGYPPGPGHGGAVASVGTLTLDGCTLNDNFAIAGVSWPSGPNGIVGAEGGGGAIYAEFGSFTATNSTFAFNRAQGSSLPQLFPTNGSPLGGGRGGALLLVSNTAMLVNVTFAFNTAAPGTSDDTNFNNGEAFGGGIASVNSTVTLRHSILASNAPGNLFGNVTDSGYNLSSDATVGLSAVGSRTNLDARLGPLATNGGPTRTMALLPGSPARDLIPSGVILSDQRGVARPQGTGGDSGAYEARASEDPPMFTLQPASASLRAGTNVTFQSLATGAPPVRYSWFKDGALVPHATNAILMLTNLQTDDAGAYFVLASNGFGVATSSTATLTVDFRPLLFAQPQDVVAAPGGAANFTVTANGPALTYLWFHNGLAISDATNATLSLANTMPGAQGGYLVVVTNFAGTVTSRVARLTFSPIALNVFAPPQNATVAAGGSTNFSVLVSGIPPFSYQWLFGTVPLSNETNDVLTIAVAGAGNAGGYRVVVTNAYLSVTSAPAVLTVVSQVPPSFVVMPLGANLRMGTNFTLLAGVDGTAPLTYSWFQDGILIPDATNTTLVFTNIQTTNAGEYTVIAANNFGAATSQVATIIVDARPLLLRQPGDAIIAPGGSTNFSVAADGPALNYAWWRDGQPVPDATNAVLAISNAIAGAQGSYQIIVTNFAGAVTSRVAMLTFNTLTLIIVTPPESLTVTQGSSATFRVLVSGLPPFRYQWLFGIIPVPDETNSVLTIPGTEATNAGAYRVVVTNDYLSVTSAPAVLTLVSPLLLVAAAQGQDLLITCHGPPGCVARLLCATSLSPTAIWQPMATNTLSTSGTFTWPCPRPTNGTVFFRTVSP